MKKIIIILTVILGWTVAHGQTGDTIIFQKKKNSNRLYSIVTPTYCDIRQNNGSRITGYIFSVTDSVFTFRIHNTLKPVDGVTARKIAHDKSLTKQQRALKYLEFMYDSTVKISIPSIRQMRFGNFQAPNFGKKLLIYATATVGMFAVFGVINKLTIPPPKNNQDLGVTPYVILGELITVIIVDYFFIITRRISPKKWAIKK